MKLFTFALLAIGLKSVSTLSCSPGEVPDTNGICIEPRFIQGCSQYASTLSCAKCEYKYKLNSNGLCQYVTQVNQPCCLEKVDGKCTKCSAGLKLLPDGTCKQNNILGCLQKDWNGDCKNCASDYRLSSGTCEQGIRDCEKYLKDQKILVCTKCKNNFSLVNNACLKNKILGCEFQLNHKCQKCLQPFKPKGDHCQISNCQAYNDFGCTACQCGYFLNPQNLCEEIQPGCIRYQRGICYDCQNHFKLRGGSCIMEGCLSLDFLTCTKCADNYDLNNGGCRLKNCISWDNGICFACDEGFVTSQGKCIKQAKLSRDS